MTPDLLPIAQELDVHLRAIREVLRRPLEAVEARGSLTGPQRSVMQVVATHDGLSLKNLSQKVGLSHSTVSGIVDRLEKRGMLTRHTDEKDGRCTRIAVTQQVRDFLRDTLPGLSVHPLIEALGRATETERAAVLDGLRTLRRLMDGSREDAALSSPMSPAS